MPILKQKKFLLSIILATVFLVPAFQPVQARGLVPCGGYTASGQAEPPCTVEDIFRLFAIAINFLIGTAGVYAVFQILNAGFWLITTSGDEEKITQWKTGLSNAVVGFVLVMLAFIFVNTTVNFLLSSKCKVDLKNPLSYLTNCPANPVEPNTLQAQ